MKHTFQLKKATLVLALAAAYPLFGHTAAGVTQFTSGEVNVRRGPAVVALNKGRDIETGDSIVTGSSGRVQIRFTDGGLVSIQPNSQFDITKYVDANDGAQDSFLVNFARGSMRAITGLIGKRNRDNYKVQTATATVGIRGSGFSAAYNTDGSLSVTSELGEIEVCTSGGCVRLLPGESALVVSNTEAPVRSLVRANLPTPAPRQEVTITGNSVTAGGLSALIKQPTTQAKVPLVPTAPTLPAAVPVIETVTTPWAAAFVLPNGSVLNEDNTALTDKLTLESFNGQTKPTKFDSATTQTIREPLTVGSFGSAGATSAADFLGWGHWSTAKITNTNTYSGGSSVANDVHYIVGKPTTGTQMAALSGLFGTYSLLGGTATFKPNTGSSVVGSVTAGSLSVAFGVSSANISGNVTTKFGATSVNVDLGSSTTGSKITCGNSNQIAGFFTGANANRIGMLFRTTNTGCLGSGAISGSVGFAATGAPTSSVTAAAPRSFTAASTC